MPRFAANLTMLFIEVPFLDRFPAAAQAGFKAVEFMFPYDFPKEAVADALHSNGLELALHNLPAGDWPGGERGIACIPGRESEFRDGVARAIDYAKTLGAPKLNCLVGIPPAGTDPAAARAVTVANLRYAAEELSKAGIGFVVEAVNTRDIPGFLINTSAGALSIMDEVAHSNLLLQYDIYHMQVMEGDLAPTIERLMPRIGHVQVADNPGRHEPGTGEINFSFLFALLDRLGYTGWIGCEYKPAAATGDGLGWMRAAA